MNRLAVPLLATTVAACLTEPAPRSISPVAPPASADASGAGRPEGARSILDATEEELKGGHLWLIYLGPQKVPVEHIAFRAPGEPDLWSTPLHDEIRRLSKGAGAHFWIWNGREIQVSPAELKRMLNATKDLLRAEPPDLLRPYLAVAVAVRRAQGITSEEYVLGRPAKERGILLYQRLFHALDPANGEARNAIVCQRIHIDWDRETDPERCVRE